MRLTVAAGAEKAAAADRGAAVRAEAEAEADADKIRSLATRIRLEVDAEGTRLMNEAQNMLTPDARLSAMRMKLIDKLEAIIRESVKPMERIEGIKILHVDGLGGGGGGSGGRVDSGDVGGGLADSVVNSALLFRRQAPRIDQLLLEIGVQGGDVGGWRRACSTAPRDRAARRCRRTRRGVRDGFPVIPMEREARSGGTCFVDASIKRGPSTTRLRRLARDDGR